MAEGLPTATGFAAKEAIAALRKHYVEIAPLLRRASLSEHDLTLAENDGNPTSHRISAVAQLKFLDYAAEAMNDTAFGLHLAGQIDPRDLGIFFYVGSAPSDVGEALPQYPIASTPSRSCRQSFPANGMLQFLYRLAHGAEHKCVAREVERRVTAVNGAMMVRADKHEVPEIVAAATAEPADVMRLA